MKITAQREFGTFVLIAGHGPLVVGTSPFGRFGIRMSTIVWHGRFNVLVLVSRTGTYTTRLTRPGHPARERSNVGHNFRRRAAARRTAASDIDRDET